MKKTNPLDILYRYFIYSYNYVYKNDLNDDGNYSEKKYWDLCLFQISRIYQKYHTFRTVLTAEKKVSN